MVGKAVGRSSTAIEALQGADLTGKTAIVTGGNSGIGVETVRALAYAGARVILTSRVVEAGEKVAKEMKESGVKGDVVVKQLDLADTASVRAFAKDVLATEKHIDILILNAGVMACPKTYTKDGFEMQIGTNHFGHFLLTQLLLPKILSQNTPARIVAVSSVAHVFGAIVLDDLHYKNRSYGSWASYGQSKLANVLFVKELARRTEGTKVRVFSLHPGNIQSPLQRHTSFSLGTWLNWIMGYFIFDRNIEQGAATSIYAATSPALEGQSGAYLADCKVKAPSKRGTDMEMAAKLWAETEKQLEALPS